MLEKQAGDVVELLPQASEEYLQHPYYEITRDVYQTIHRSGLYKFTVSWIDSLWNDLSAVVYELEHVSEEIVHESLEVIERLTEAQNELRLARFLFEVEEINPLYRLIMRNRAILRSEYILHKVLQIWPIVD